MNELTTRELMPTHPSKMKFFSSRIQMVNLTTVIGDKCYRFCGQSTRIVRLFDRSNARLPSMSCVQRCFTIGIVGCMLIPLTICGDAFGIQSPKQSSTPVLCMTESDNTPSETEIDNKKSESSDKSESASSKHSGRNSLLTVKVLRDEVYNPGLGSAGQCDVFLPVSDSPSDRRPVIVLVHGGGWVSGDKWNVTTYAHQLAERGFVAISINYRHAPKHQFPKQVDDVRTAMLWIEKHRNRFQVDTQRLGMFGYSAGGHLTALVASMANESIEVRHRASQWEINDARWPKLPLIRAICIGGPPCDFQSLPPDNTSMTFFLGETRRRAPEKYRAASPLAHVSTGDPPTLIIQGDSDLMVPLIGSEIFHRKQVGAGVESKLVVLPKHGHFLTFINPRTSEEMILHFLKHLEPGKMAESITNEERN